MELNLTASNYTLESSNDIREMSTVDELPLVPPQIQFVGKIGDKIVFEMVTREGARAKRWTKLADACAFDSKYGEDWKTYYGENYINVEHDLVEFTTAVARGCFASIFISARCCIDAFREAARLTEAWVDGQ